MARYWLSPLIVAGSVLTSTEERNTILKQRSRVVKFEQSSTLVAKKINQTLVSSNLPGASVVVHVDGEPILRMGAGYSDVENNTLFHCQTSMRIASISKLITSMITLHLHQEDKIDIDKPIGSLLRSKDIELFYEGIPQEITIRQLLNHTAGIRHYHDSETSDSDAKEFISSENFLNVHDALSMFIKDPLLSQPGTNYTYTTFGYSLLSYVLEIITENSFDELLREFTKTLDLKDTRLDSNKDIISNRCRYYRTENGKLINSPSVDNSCKWAGGGMVSTADDIAKLGDILMYCYQNNSTRNYLNCLDNMLEVNDITKNLRKNGTEFHYGLGVAVDRPITANGKKRQCFQFYHTGGAVGASSILLIRPIAGKITESKPSGITVVIFCNHEKGNGIIRLANEIANLIEEEINDCQIVM